MRALDGGGVVDLWRLWGDEGAFLEDVNERWSVTGFDGLIDDLL